MNAAYDPVTRRGLELVSDDLESRGWLVEAASVRAPARLWASRPGLRRVVYLACSRYPEAPPAAIDGAAPTDEGEAWVARVQVTRALAPILGPDYVRLPPAAASAAAAALPSPWPPSPLALTF
jgi:hypothetical protein